MLLIFNKYRILSILNQNQILKIENYGTNVLPFPYEKFQKKKKHKILRIHKILKYIGTFLEIILKKSEMSKISNAEELISEV